MLGEETVNKNSWKQIRILKMENGESVLIFIRETSEQANELVDFFIEHGNFSLKVFIDENKRFYFTIQFEGDEDGIEFHTGKTKEDYPPLGWLQNGLVKYFSAGYIGEGKQVFYNQRIQELGTRLHLN